MSYCHVKCFCNRVFCSLHPPRTHPYCFPHLSLYTCTYLLSTGCTPYRHLAPWVQEKHNLISLGICTLYSCETNLKKSDLHSVNSNPGQTLYLIFNVLHYWTFTFLDSSSWCRPTTTRSPRPERNTYIKILWEEDNLSYSTCLWKGGSEGRFKKKN